MTTECLKPPLVERMRAVVVANDIEQIRRRLQKSRGNTMKLVHILVHLAVTCPSLPVLTFLFEENRFSIDIHCRLSNSGATMLHYAAACGHMAIVKYLIQKGANINQPDNLGASAFHCAAARGSKEAVEYFVGIGVDINQTDNTGETALHKAADKANIIDYLAQCDGIDIDAVDQDGDSALHTAAAFGHDSAGESLIKGGANVHIRNQKNQMPLHCAALAGHESFVALLVENKADIDALGSTGTDAIESTALSLAIHKSNESTMRRLVHLGADVNKPNSVGEAPLGLFLWRLDESNLRFLIDHGADPNLRHADGATPLHIAAATNSELAASLLLNMNVNIDAQTNAGDTPLHFAVSEMYASVAALFMEHGASVHICNNRGETPLHDAAHNGGIDSAVELVKHGAEIDVCNIYGCTPLHSACWSGQLNMIEFLVKNGASVLRRNSVDGCLPLDDAIINEKSEAVLLVSKIMRALEHERLLALAILMQPLDLPVLVLNTLYRCLPPKQPTKFLVAWYDGWNLFRKIKQENPI